MFCKREHKLVKELKRLSPNHTSHSKNIPALILTSCWSGSWTSFSNRVQVTQPVVME